MSITGIDTAAGSGITSADTSKSLASGKKLAESFDTFLTMLTVQLKNQDPLSPMDSTEFTNQLVQFANVEQQISANTNLEKLIGVGQTNLKAQAISYIGRTIETESGQVPLQDGKANFSFTLPEEAKTVAVVIKDSAGAVVRSLSAETGKGRHEMSWDGRNSSGIVQPDGAYSVEVVAVNGEGESLETAVTVYGKVSDVASDNKETLLAMGKVVTTVDKVLTVRDTATVN
jgi:flagellar basal-body rod modification protein FlgD